MHKESSRLIPNAIKKEYIFKHFSPGQIHCGQVRKFYLLVCGQVHVQRKFKIIK